MVESSMSGDINKQKKENYKRKNQRTSQTQTRRLNDESNSEHSRKRERSATHWHGMVEGRRDKAPIIQTL